MRSIYQWPLWLLLVLVWVSCASPITSEHEGLCRSLHWISGQWRHTSVNGIYLEWWEVKDDSTLVGGSRFISEDDTSMQEELILQESQGALNYTALVKDQNEGKPITFSLKSHNDSVWTFENLLHDFPTRIEYVRLNNDSILARISGKDELGETIVESFALARVK